MTAKTPRMLSREEILAARLASEVVEVPEWGGSITVRELTGTERDRYIASLYQMRPNGRGGVEVGRVSTEGASARLVAASVVGPDGERMFTDVDVLALGDRGSAALERVSKIATRLSRLGETPEELASALGEGQSGSSGSA